MLSVSAAYRVAANRDLLEDVDGPTLRLADELGIDVMDAARAKQAAAGLRFPADGFRGVAPEKA